MQSNLLWVYHIDLKSFLKKNVTIINDSKATSFAATQTGHGSSDNDIMDFRRTA